MRQLILVAALVVVVLLGVGIVLLGAFPPHLTPQPVSQTLPNDRFQTK